MPITQQDLDNLDAAIVSGELTVTFQGRTVTLQSTDALIKARAHAAQVLAQQQSPKPAAPTMGGMRVAYADFSN